MPTIYRMDKEERERQRVLGEHVEWLEPTSLEPLLGRIGPGNRHLLETWVGTLQAYVDWTRSGEEREHAHSLGVEFNALVAECCTDKTLPLQYHVMCVVEFVLCGSRAMSRLGPRDLQFIATELRPRWGEWLTGRDAARRPDENHTLPFVHLLQMRYRGLCV